MTRQSNLNGCLRQILFGRLRGCGRVDGIGESLPIASIHDHPAARLCRQIRRINHFYAFHGQIDAGARFSALADSAHEILQLLGEAAKPVFVATRAVPARLRLEFFPGWRQTYTEPTGVLRCKSTVCGLNGHRLYCIISLFKVTYKSTIQVSRNFHALFTKTLENSDTCD
jgi:hypothetical protein